LIPCTQSDFDDPECLMLIATKTKIISSCKIYTLPFFSGDVYIPQVLKELDPKLIKNIYIGISSPKQNQLAIELQSYFPESEISCVGAALDIVIENGNQTKNNFFSKSGFEWLYMLFKDPKRGLFKISVTLKAVFLIIMSQKHKKAWISFLNSTRG
jgi:UDP-N-acetyl-D-mannosaminuronic acid transferase (WecB/TagA/CpsF family)